ncbi:T9SS type A sorting domain-containing protein [Flavobacterium phycosphaerae]|uniref:T9SS type A sorting domain-containing protein n=1 Tax=Flavobacterium phycosphaerae TaxID=2697515 RepID=UPI00138ACAA3|nr:T9SS type A sorting domain-containing protein [Flavobacterium phycosphaerae]
MKKLYITGLLLVLSALLQAQTFEWLATPAITFSANPEGIGYPTATDQLGNTFVCGFKDNAHPYTDIFGNLWFLKFNPSGQVVFSKVISGTVNAYKMLVDGAGNLYIAAAYIDEIQVDDLHLTTNLQGVKPILLKFDNNGNLLWHKTIPDMFVEHFKALAIDEQQNIYIGYDTYMDSYIEKLDANGNSLQLITQTQVKSISSVSIDTEGNIFATGSCAETNVSFNGTPMTNTLPYNTYLVKYNSYGQMQWMHFVEDVTCPEPQVLVRTPDEVYFSSYLFGNYTFGNLTTEGPINGFSDFFLAKLNSNGVYQWVKEVPGAGEVIVGNRNYLALDTNGNLYLTARTRGTIQWSPTISTQTAGFNHDLIVLKYNPQGEVLWAKLAGGNSEDRADGITVLPDNNVVLTGIVNGDVTFDALTHNSAGFAYYPFVSKLNTTTLNVNSPSLHSISVYPNPAQTTLVLAAKDYTETASIYNLLGQKLKTVNCRNETTTIDITTLPKGTYFIRLENNQVIRFVKA